MATARTGLAGQLNVSVQEALRPHFVRPTFEEYPRTGDNLRPLVSVVLPCLNEAQTVGQCAEKALVSLGKLELRAGPVERLAPSGGQIEVVVSDNGSTDGSPEAAMAAGARVVHCPNRGYGAAVQFGVTHSHGQFIVMADADDTYELDRLDLFVKPLIDNQCDMVIGNRFAGGIQPGAMPWKNRYIGNPVLTGMLRLLFGGTIGDAHCGLRSFTREAYERMNPVQPGMEYASEVVVRALQHNLRIVEVPTKLFADRVDRAPHLRPWRDGWRHLKWMLKERAYLTRRRWSSIEPHLEI